MKSLIVLVVGLLSVGCKTIPVKELTQEQKQQKALRDSVVGEYEQWDDGRAWKIVLLDNGVYEYYYNGKKTVEYKWKISKELELHIASDSGISVYRINIDKSITKILFIIDGKRKYIPKIRQSTYKRLTLKEKKALEDLRGSIVGEYEVGVLKYVLLENGVYEFHLNGKIQKGKWIINIDGELHTIGKGTYVIGVFRINRDGSIITAIANIIEGERINSPKEAQHTYKKIK